MPARHIVIHVFVAAFLWLPHAAAAAETKTPASPEEVEGVVTFVGAESRNTFVELRTEAGPISVKVAPGTGPLTELLLKSRVRVRGVSKPIITVDGKKALTLVVSRADDLTIVHLPEETWRRYPLSAANTLQDKTRIARVRGRIHSSQPGKSFLLVDESGQLTVAARQAAPGMAGVEVETLGVLTGSGTNLVFQSAFCRAFTGFTPAELLPTLTATEQIRWLDREEVRRKHPVKLRGVITYVAVYTNGSVRACLQDSTGGIFVSSNPKSSGDSTPFRVGDFCELEGGVGADGYSPFVVHRKLTVLGPGQFPEPRRPGYEELAHGTLDAQWVEVSGVVLGFSGRRITLGMNGGRIRCSVPSTARKLVSPGATVRVRGVVYVHPNRRSPLERILILAVSLSGISVETPGSTDPFSASTVRLSELSAYDPNNSAFRRLKMTGQVVHARNGVYHVMDGARGMRVIVNGRLTSGAGDVIEAVGFPEIDRPFNQPLVTLREALVRKAGKASLPRPATVAATNLPNRELDSTLVRLESRLLNISHYQTEQVLELQAGSVVYLARLEARAGRFPELKPGSLVDISGVYAVTSGESRPFELLLNSAAAVRVLEPPPWWTSGRAAMVVSGLGVVIVLGVVWIGMLRQQVGKRTTELSAANLQLRKEIVERERAENELVQTRTQHLIERERTRIARDIHDELGCSLSEIHLLSEMTLLRNRAPTDLQSDVSQISAKALQTTRVLDEIVWAVDPKHDTLESLWDYLFNFADDYLFLAGIRLRVDAPAKIPSHPLTAHVRHQVYMAVKETLTNIVKHAHASEVRIQLRVENHAATFVIEDNGRGFTPAPKAAPGADGLENLQTRFQEIGGRFELNSVPGAGTRVEFTLPVS